MKYQFDSGWHYLVHGLTPDIADTSEKTLRDEPQELELRLSGLENAEKPAILSMNVADLGAFDAETVRLEPIENPFRTDVLPMCPV